MRAFNENRDSSLRGRGGRGRGNRIAHRPKADKSEAEADIAEITSGGVSCFNAEITGEISDMSTLNDDDTEASQDRPTPTVLFTCSEDTQPKTDKQPDPKVESSPMDSESAVPLNSGSVFSSSWAVVTLVLAFLGGLLFGVCAGTYNTILYCLKKYVQIFQSAGFMLLSFISNPMHPAQSATACSTAQYKPHFRFFGGSYIQYGITTAILIMIVAILLQCGAQAASIGPQKHVNATKLLLTTASISPFLSEQAAESLLQYKNGSWLLPYQRDDLEAHVATTRSADRDISLDWCLDSGASCHFCNDSSKFVSMRKCSTAKKGKLILKIGVGNRKITTQTATANL
jgi:hypothetical protein